MNWEVWVMTLKTSFFNFGIYKNTIKRFWLGSMLYFIFLFIATSLTILLNKETLFARLDIRSDIYANSLILNSEYFTVPLLLSIVVPTVTALLVFRFIHSKKQAIFTFSLPINRNENYISSYLAGLTLMFLPVLLNGIILMLLSVAVFSKLFTLYHCLLWILYNMLALFLMYSCAVFCATLTGNSFAMVILNILIHSIIFIFALCFNAIADIFLYGYVGSELVDLLAANNFPSFIMMLTSKHAQDNLLLSRVIVFICFAICFSVAAFFIIRKRKIETATDIAGFKSLNSVFKYLITVLITFVVFALFQAQIGTNNIVFVIILLIISALSYFLVEMLLKKKFNVFSTWKGYTIFAICFTVIILFVINTSFFGYETRVPSVNDIEAADIYNFRNLPYNEKNVYIEDTEIVEKIAQVHSDIVNASPIPKHRNIYRDYFTYDNYSQINISYKLKNGKTMRRCYNIPTEKCIEIMEEFYKAENFKKKNEAIFIDDSKVSGITLNHEQSISEWKELLPIIRDDVLNMSYHDLHYAEYIGITKNTGSLRLEYKDESISSVPPEINVYMRHHYLNFTDKYVKTINWLKEKGYM